MDKRFADYNVRDKRDTLAWNAATRTALDARAALRIAKGILSECQLATLKAVKQRVCPEFADRPPTTTVAMIVRKIARDESDGTRHHRLPGTAECWRRGLDAIDAEAHQREGRGLAELTPDQVDTVLRCIERGDTRDELWEKLPPQPFWRYRLVPDLISAHWAQPQAWSAMGFGGPASPRGYVRLDANRRDPWEAIEHGDTPRFGLPLRHGGRA